MSGMKLQSFAEQTGSFSHVVDVELMFVSAQQETYLVAVSDVQVVPVHRNWSRRW